MKQLLTRNNCSDLPCRPHLYLEAFVEVRALVKVCWELMAMYPYSANLSRDGNKSTSTLIFR